MLLLAVALAGCAGPGRHPGPLHAASSRLPAAIVTPPAGDLQLSRVLADPARHTGTRVRWGGTILGLEQGARGARLEVLGAPLDRAGRPVPGRPSGGRFAIRAAAPLDASDYAPGREITVAGVLEGETRVPAGDAELLLPMVRAEVTHLWSAAARDPERSYAARPGRHGRDARGGYSHYGPHYGPHYGQYPYYRYHGRYAHYGHHRRPWYRYPYYRYGFHFGFGHGHRSHARFGGIHLRFGHHH